MPAEFDNSSSDTDITDADIGADSALPEQQASRSENLMQAAVYLRRAAACKQEVFGTATQAKAAALQVKRLRRLVFTASVVTLHEMAESRICDQHGYASSKVMCAAVNKQSTRDVHGLEQVRKMFDRCDRILKAARKARLSEDHLRLIARVYANRRVRDAFVSQ